MNRTAISWALQIVAAVILGQTLFFKFSGAEEPVYIFTKLGAEPWGRLGTAVFELIAMILLLTPWQPVLGAGLSVGLMVGALGAHLGPLGIEVKGDHGLLFCLGVVTLLCSVGVIWLRWNEGLQLVRMTRAALARSV